MDYADQRKRVIEMVGETVLEWNELETYLAAVFGLCLGLPGANGVELLQVVTSFQSKLQLVDVAFRQKYTGAAELAFWDGYCKYLNELSGQRHTAAHGILVYKAATFRGFGKIGTVALPDKVKPIKELERGIEKIKFAKQRLVGLHAYIKGNMVEEAIYQSNFVKPAI